MNEDGQRIETSSYKMNQFSEYDVQHGDNSYNIVHLKFAKRVDLRSSYQTHKKWYLCKVIDLLTNLIVIIIAQYMGISNHHIVHLKLTCVICQLYHNNECSKSYQTGHMD